ncbi:unnamed protein product [Ambrosiozyma monospora]|uniref:Unnamed protein product n=1 Tax=Ambrosiozyma monospora TaxID=43982 RepID=A0ACB5SWT8_AMBMO|nr:unnamed protein product [Ambrosiozyma monospora]
MKDTIQRLTRDSKFTHSIRSNGFIAQIDKLSHQMEDYNDDAAQAAAIDVVLSSPVYDRVDKIEESKEGKEDEFDYTDHLVQQLLKWFKEEFFTWVNTPSCDSCGNKENGTITPLGGCRGYTQDHIDGRASMVERYRCNSCGTVNEFPRYGNAMTLLKFRKGRCGEWANCFTLILKSLGLKVRYVWNLEDHVWCEYYSKNLKRFIHLDPCENAFDNPLLYNHGWGKKMSYVFAISDHYI